jgi:hypothetical protein
LVRRAEFRRRRNWERVVEQAYLLVAMLFIHGQMVLGNCVGRRRYDTCDASAHVWDCELDRETLGGSRGKWARLRESLNYRWPLDGRPKSLVWHDGVEAQM